MKKETTWIVLAFLVLLSLFFIGNLYLVGILDRSLLEGSATQQTTSVALSIVDNEKNLTVPASGNITFSSGNVRSRITKLSSLTSGLVLNVTLYGQSLPSNWTSARGDDVGSQRFEYFQITANSNDYYYYIYFNITAAELKNVTPRDVKVYFFDEDEKEWEDVNTYVYSSLNNPREFYATVEDFGRFIIAGEGNDNSSIEETDDDGSITFIQSSINEIITGLAGCEKGWLVNISLSGSAFPNYTGIREPNETEIGLKQWRYFVINVNGTSSGSNRYIYFNLSQEALGNVTASNVSLFFYNTTTSEWDNLSTTVINGTANPASFFATTPHFSNFFIAQKPAVASSSGSSGEDTGSGVTSGAGGGGASTGAAVRKAAENGVPEVEQPPIAVRPEKFLFDIKVEVLLESKQVLPGDVITAQVVLENIGSPDQLLNVVHHIYLLDLERNITIAERQEKFAVGTTLEFVKRILVPSTALPGKYLFISRIEYLDQTVESFDVFDVVTAKSQIQIPLGLFLSPHALIAVGSAIVIVLIMVGIWFFFHHREERKIEWKVGKEKNFFQQQIKRTNQTEKELRQQMKELERLKKRIKRLKKM